MPLWRRYTLPELPGGQHYLRPNAAALPANAVADEGDAASGMTLIGLPVVGFVATGYINANSGGSGIRHNFTSASNFARKPVCVQDGHGGGCH